MTADEVAEAITVKDVVALKVTSRSGENQGEVGKPASPVPLSLWIWVTTTVTTGGRSLPVLRLQGHGRRPSPTKRRRPPSP